MSRSVALLILAVLMVFLTSMGWFLGEETLRELADQLVSIINGLENWGPLVWVVVFALLAAFFFPVAILSVASGALFGVGLGTFLTLTAATMAATLSMVLGRSLVSKRLETHIGDRAAELRQRVDDEGWRFVAFTRLVPLMPFALLNFSFGLTHIRILPYALTTFLFMLPARWAYAYAGEVGWSVFQANYSVYKPWLLTGAVLATLIYGWRVLRPQRSGTK